MDGRAMTADLFGRAGRETILLHPPVPARRVVLDSLTATVEPVENGRWGVSVTCHDDTPLQALCGALVGLGAPDCALQVVRPDGEAVCFVASFHQAAGICAREPVLAGRKPDTDG